MDEQPLTPLLIAAQAALTPEEKTAFLATFTELNPHYRGAQVADVLALLHSTDAHCGLLEEFHAEHRSQGIRPGVVTLATYLAIYVDGGREPDWPRVEALAGRLTAALA